MKTQSLAKFLTLTANLKSLTTRKRIAKQLLGSRHPIVAELRAAQRAARKERVLIAPDMVVLGQDYTRAALVQAHGVDEGAFAEECLLAAEGAEA
jgi:hypothetical protein